MSWLLEDPTWWWVGGAALLAMLGIALVQTGRGALLGAMAGVLVLTALGLAVEWLVVTPREEVEGSLEQLRAALEANDISGVLAGLHPNAGALRQEAESRLPDMQVQEARVSGLEIGIDPRDPNTAQAKFFGRINFRDPSGQVPYENMVRRFLLTFQRQDGRWLVSDYRLDDIAPGLGQ
jgi:hypothetical protein